MSKHKAFDFDNTNGISSSCTNCGNTRSVSAKYIGKKIKCRSCNTSYRITQPDSTAQSELIELTPEDTVTASARIAKKSGESKEVTDEMLLQYGDIISPDNLMGDFKGKGISGIFLFTILIHVILLIVSSLPYIQSEYFDTDPTEIEETKKKEMAFDDVTTIIEEIAEKYNMQPSDITDKFSKSGSRSDKVKDKKIKSKKVKPEASPENTGG